MSADLGDLPPLREVIAAHGLGAIKSLGQHFLLDLNLTRKIARAAGPLTDHTVIEVGPGPGGLTRALLQEGAAEVVAIERDTRFAEALEQIAQSADGRLRLVRADALAVDESSLLDQDRPVKIVANLPYNVGTPLLIKWLEADPWPPWYQSLTLMFQKEVADRLTAPCHTKVYGRLSVLAQWRCEVAPLLTLPARAFTPAPKVDSAVVQLRPRQTPTTTLELKALQTVTAAAFNQRRKMLRASLRNLAKEPESLLEAAGLDPTLRADHVSIEQYDALSRAYLSSADSG